MFRRNLYYMLKPFLPIRVRRAIRGMLARRKLARFRDVWPIDERAGRTPAGWPGWPDGKEFALALSHDVEGTEGVANVRALAELEMSLGFRSSFNFVPEGDYETRAELRAWLIEHGFEVGVHDLHHDGWLFSSRDAFRAKARRINEHLRAWGATGFRAGFMLRNLDWFHDLDITYDASTFDTDPFEPQPDGAGTIFPFWVNRQSDAAERSAATSDDHRIASRDGYCELPYTLPQDSTLFLILREPGIEIWQKKLEWVAQKGGMALANIHPDYLCFTNRPRTGLTFPASHYASFLRWIRANYEGRFWHARPADVADYFCASRRVGEIIANEISTQSS